MSGPQLPYLTVYRIRPSSREPMNLETQWNTLLFYLTWKMPVVFMHVGGNSRGNFGGWHLVSRPARFGDL